MKNRSFYISSFQILTPTPAILGAYWDLMIEKSKVYNDSRETPEQAMGCGSSVWYSQEENAIVEEL